MTSLSSHGVSTSAFAGFADGVIGTSAFADGVIGTSAFAYGVIGTSAFAAGPSEVLGHCGANERGGHCGHVGHGGLLNERMTLLSSLP